VKCCGYILRSEASCGVGYRHDRHSRFVQTLESPEIKMLRFPGLESPGKCIGPGKLVKVLDF